MGEANTSGLASLKDMAFDAFYKKLVLKATDPTLVDFVRDSTEFQQMGTMGKTIREKCVKKLNDSQSKQPNAVNHKVPSLADACRILDCVLDHSFAKLEIKIPVSYQLFQLVSNLISIISRRAPKLEQLEIIIVRNPATSPTPTITEDKLAPMTISNSSRLDFLKKLVLNNDREAHLRGLTLLDPSHRSVLTLVGKYCPNLVDLSVTGFVITKKDIVGLILGDLVDFLLPTPSDSEKWSKNSTLEILRVPSKHLTPLCFTLKKLYFLSKYGQSSPYGSAPVFTLRHLSALTSMDCDELYQLLNPTLQAIKILHKNVGADEEIQQEFDQVCQEAASHITSFENSQEYKSSSLHSGSLLLETVTYDDFENLDSLRIVGLMCPRLKRLSFKGVALYPLVHLQTTMEEELKSVWSGWPKAVKLESIHFDGFIPSSARIIGSILNAFASSLTSLRFSNCQRVEVEHLAGCTKLEELDILYHQILPLKANDSICCWTPDTFLPSLKKFRSDVCLGIWSPLIEGKSKLSDLKLKCSHFETDANNNTHLVWSKMPEIWPQLESLEIEQCTGLSMTLAYKLIPQMGSLRCIKLPRSVMLDDRMLTWKVTNELAKKNILVKSSAFFPSYKACPLLSVLKS